MIYFSTNLFTAEYQGFIVQTFHMFINCFLIDSEHLGLVNVRKNDHVLFHRFIEFQMVQTILLNHFNQVQSAVQTHFL